MTIFFGGGPFGFRHNRSSRFIIVQVRNAHVVLQQWIRLLCILFMILFYNLPNNRRRPTITNLFSRLLFTPPYIILFSRFHFFFFFVAHLYPVKVPTYIANHYVCVHLNINNINLIGTITIFIQFSTHIIGFHLIIDLQNIYI